jgi:L-amino acid N-acyltransferase YncA
MVRWYNGRRSFVANPPTVPIRHAQTDDLPAIVAIYNASIPGRRATADTEPVTVAARQAWFREFDPESRPLWVCDAAPGGPIAGWLGLRSFYGRPAYRATVEAAVYVDPQVQRRGLAKALLAHALAAAPGLGVRTLLGFIFAHNAPSLALFAQAGFVAWGRLPGVAVLDSVERDLVILGRKVG